MKPSMHSFVELWVYLSATPLFGLTATLAVYVAAQAVYVGLQHAPWANPVLWTVVLLAGLLAATGIAYPSYFAGAQFIHFLLGPAVVALAWPMWQRRAELRLRWRALGLAALVGGGAAAGSAVLVGWGLGLPPEVLASLAPKSVTAPVAMGIAEQLGGIPALAAVLAVLTGLVGAVCAKPLFDALRIRRLDVRGFALGTVSHGIGAARALQVHPVAGAYAALALGLQVVLGALLLPLAYTTALPLLLALSSVTPKH
jgi:predicted murein hydrolase (TIGR00659 family)